MSRLGVTLKDRVSTGPRDGAGFKSRGPGAEDLAPTHPLFKVIITFCRCVIMSGRNPDRAFKIHVTMRNTVELREPEVLGTRNIPRVIL